jgi:hypothetical protein
MGQHVIWSQGYFLLAHVEAEGVTRGIKEHPDVCLRLVAGFLSPELQRVGDGSWQVSHLEVKVHRDPLRPFRGGPDRTHVLDGRLKGDVSNAVGRCDGSILWALFVYLPSEKLRVEPGQRPRVGSLEDDPPPVAPGPSRR